MNVIDIIRSRKPSPNARGEGILTARAFKKSTAALYLDVMLAELEKDLGSALETDRLAGWPEEQKRRIEETF